VAASSGLVFASSIAMAMAIKQRQLSGDCWCIQCLILLLAATAPAAADRSG
jgi:hypothetical protein